MSTVDKSNKSRRTELLSLMRLLGHYLRFNLSAAMAYRTSFLMQVFGMVLNNSAFIFFWWILFSNTERIGGYQFRDVMLLWSLASACFGLTFVLFGNTREITRLIIGGELDTFLLQPKDPLVSILCAKSSVSAWGDLLYGIALYIFTMGFGPLKLGLFLLLVVTGSVILTSVLVILNTLSFYIGDAQGAADLMMEFMITFSIYPEGIFSGALRYIFYTVLPIGFMAYVPAKVLVSPNPALLLLVLVVALLWASAAYLFFYRGLRRYESGNLMVTRL